MKTVHGDFKFEGMRKEQSFIIYPCAITDNTVLLQSDKRIIRIELSTGKAILSKGGRPYGVDLHPARGAVLIELDSQTILKIKKMRDAMAGVNPNKQVILSGEYEEILVESDPNTVNYIQEE
jgi:hypothetical protein